MKRFYKKGQVGAFGIILLIILFIIIFTYIAPFFGTASDVMASNNTLTGVSGFFFGNWQNVLLFLFVITVLWKIFAG